MSGLNFHHGVDQDFRFASEGQKDAAFRADPRVRDAMEVSRVGELAVGTRGPGESLAAIRDDDSFDPAVRARIGADPDQVPST